MTLLDSRRAALALTAVIFAFDLFQTPRTTLWDRDEPRFAQAAVEMVRSGQYLYPTFRGEVRAQKPILIYWLMALSIGALGVSEMAVRFWAPVGVAVTSYALWTIARRLLSARIGLLAMLIVALNPLVMLEGTAATADAVLMALVTCGVAAFVWRLTSAIALMPALVFAVALAGALLAKGPVGLLPLLVVAGTLWRRWSVNGSRRLAAESAVATVAGVALFLLWAVPANVAADGRFYTQGLLHDVVGRVLAPLEGHGGNPLLWLPFYPVVLLIGLAPWSAFVPAALHAMWRRDRPPSDRDCLLTWWIAGPFVAFSVVATHLPHYILPAWPAVSLAVASVVDSAAASRTDPPARRWIARGIPLAVVTAVVACVTLTAAPFVLHAGHLLWQSIPLAAAIVVTTALFVYFTHHADDSRAFATCLLAAMLFDAWMGFYWVPGLEAVKPVPRIAALIRARTGGAVPVATYGFGEPSLDFYLRAVPQALETAPAVIVWSNTREPGVLVTTRDLLDRIGRPSSLVEIGSSEGFNVTNGQQVELVALARGAP